MKKLREPTKVERIIDANLNRLKEGLRVCEEVTRFVLNNRSLTENLKKIRHKVSSLSFKLYPKEALLKARDSFKDIGLKINPKSEFKRERIEDIFFANLTRAKESLRVLEEFSKLKEKKCALEFKKLRYALYEIEKKFIS